MHQCQRKTNEKSSRLFHNQNGLIFNLFKLNIKSSIIYLVILIIKLSLISNVNSNIVSKDRSLFPNHNGQGPVYRTSYACEGQQLKIECMPNEQINLIRANYGRFSISICNENGELDWEVKCVSKRSYRVVLDSCNGKQNCTVLAKAGLFGEDPCPKTEKYLEAHYECMPMKQRRRQNKKNQSNSPNTSTLSTSVYPTSLNNNQLNNKTSLETNISKNNNNNNIQVSNGPTAIEQPSEENVHPNESNLLDTLGINPISQPLYCSQIVSKNLRWNRTQVGKVVEQPCPEGASGTARWFCGVSNLASDLTVRQQAEWLPSNKPDFSECSSRIVQSIERRLSANHNFANGGLSSQSINLELILQLTKELQQFTSSIVSGQRNSQFNGRIYSDDLLRIAQTLNDLIDRIKTVTQNGGQEQQKYSELFAQLVIYVQNTINDLLESSYDSWTDLQVIEQRIVSGRLMLALHKATHLLLFSINKSQDFINENSNIYISMHLRNSNVMDHLEGQNVRLSSDNLLSTLRSAAINLSTRQTNHLIKQQENSVHIPWRTLLQFGQNNLVRFALIIYKQIDQYIQPNFEIFSNINSIPSTTISSQQQPATKLQINSDLVSILLTNEPSLPIPGTVFITFKHKQNLTSNSAQLHPQTQYCALWNYELKQWQTDGCQLIESNRTHSTCECNHLSTYALLRSTLIDEQQKRDPPNLLTNLNDKVDNTIDNILTIGGYNWSFYTNQVKAQVTSSCYLSILCLSFVIISLILIQYKQSKEIKLLNKKVPINGTLTDLNSINIHYGTYHSSANNSMTYNSSTANKNTTASNTLLKYQQNQSTSCTHQNLCFILIVIELLLIFSSKPLPTKLDYENRLNCAIFAALLHYLLLSLFVWLLFDVLILYSKVKNHLNELNFLKSTDYSIPAITSLPSSLQSNSLQQNSPISKKWLIAFAYGSCSLLLLISVLLDAQSYGSALSSGHCFLSNGGPGYLYLLVLPIFIMIVCITIISFSTIKLLIKTRYPLAMNSLPTKLNAISSNLNSSSANIMINSGHFQTNSILCRQLKESIVTVIIVCLTWSAGLLYLNSAEKLPAFSTNQIGSKSYQLFGILFSALNIAQGCFFVLYYCILDVEVRKGYLQFFKNTRRRSTKNIFINLISKFKRNDKVASSLSANTINTTVSNAASILNGCANQTKQLTNDQLNKSVNNQINDQLNSQQPIIPPPQTISSSANQNNAIKNYYLNGQIDDTEKCSIDYGFPPVQNLNNINNQNRNFRTTSALHSYQIANSTLSNLNCSTNAYFSNLGNNNVVSNSIQAVNKTNEQHHLPNQIIDHVYECIDDDSPYITKLLSNYQTLNSHHILHQQLNQNKTLNIRPISSLVQHQQQQQQLSNIYQQQLTNQFNSSHLRSLSDLSNISERPLLSTKPQQHLINGNTILPAIIRDNTKTSTIIPNNSFQHQQNKLKKYHNTLNADHHFNQQQQLNAQQLLKESTLI